MYRIYKIGYFRESHFRWLVITKENEIGVKVGTTSNNRYSINKDLNKLNIIQNNEGVEGVEIISHRASGLKERLKFEHCVDIKNIFRMDLIYEGEHISNELLRIKLPEYFY